MDNFPYQTFPSGWYQLCWSKDLLPAEVRRLHIFDQDVVLYRTESGIARVVDKTCPHLGAHLGHGGKVTGECLACPFHGWEFDIDGRNTHIPFLDRPNSRARLSQWTVQEDSGLVLVWHDALGRDPLWQWPGVPEFVDSENFYEPSCYDAGILRVLPHQDKENAADLYHFPFVHGSGQPMKIIDWDTDTHVMRVVYEMGFGVGKDSTFLTPDGPLTAIATGEGYMGVGLVRFEFDGILVTQAVATTPVNKNESMLFSTTCGSRQPDSPDEPAGRTKFFVEAQHTQIQSDFNIWENQTWIDRPPLSGNEEKYFIKYRQWLRQFYPDADKVVNARGERKTA